MDEQLTALVVKRAAEPFAWGTSDCAMWAFDAVHALTGTDPAADLRGTYSTALRALRLVEAEGGWPAICARRIGEPVALDMLRTGDVVQIDPQHCADDMAHLGSLGVFWRGHVVCQGDTGLVQLPRAVALAAWRPRHG